MFELFKPTYIFSVKGVASLFLPILIAWLLQDYPEWRAKRLKNTLVGDKKSKAPAEQQQQLQQQEEDKDKQPNDKSNKDDNLSIAHYILVSPFAAVYIITRAILDIIRFSLYFMIWSCERSMPYIDDWLFDTVTIWIPRKFNEIEKWWIKKGQPSFILYKTQFKQNTLPTIVENMELLFNAAYKIGCIVHKSMQNFISAWKRFVERHDWRQLSQDLSEIAETIIWNPTVWFVTRSIKLCKLIYSGLYSAIISIKNEIIWSCTVIIPTIFNYIVSTRLARLLYTGTVKLSNGIQWICLNINNYLLAPTLGRFLTWLVRGIDKIILLLSTHTFQQRLRRIYKWISPNLVWTVIEISSMVVQVVKWAQLFFNQLVYPAYNLFITNVKPQLAIAYQSIIVKWLFEAHLYPTWFKICPYLNIPLHWVYNHLIAAMLNGLYKISFSIYQYVTQQILVQVQVVSSKMIKFSMVYAQWVYSHIQLWLIKQAPILSNMISKLYDTMINSCDWNQLGQDIWTTATLMYSWISEQSNMVYLSLERSLSAWAKEQQPVESKEKTL
jgi:hypothetical protein